jgi:tight adherence protein C
MSDLKQALFLSGVALAVSLAVISMGLWYWRAKEVSKAYQRPLFWRLTDPLLRPLELWFERVLPHSWRIRLTHFSNAADLSRSIGPGALCAATVFAAAFGVIVGVWIASLTGLSLSSIGLTGAALLGVLPYAWVRDRAIKREQAILRQLPFVLDLITLSVESGLNLTAALVETVEKGPAGVIRDELDTVLRDIRAGVTRAQALDAFGNRLRLPAISNFVAGLVAADRQGGAIGPLLRGQAIQRRNERFARAEKLAMQAPVKMLFPLIAFIFPCTFIILFFPIFHRLIAEGWLK